MLKLIKVILLFFLLQLCLLQHGYADTSVEFGVEDDLTVNGTGGNSADADLEVKGYSLFGNTGAPASLKVTSGAGSVYIQNNLELGGSAYLLGNSGIGTTEASSRLLIKAAAAGTGFTLRLQDSNLTDTAAFLDNGNAGIGTTSPITQLHIPGKVPASAVGSVATGSNPRSVYVQGRYAYVLNSVGNTLQIFDVSNPNSPSPVGSVATLSDPYSVYVQGCYAYVVDGIIPSSGALQIFDVSNPNSPSPVGSVATGTTPTFLYVQGCYAYVVHIGGTDSLQIYDVSNPASPSRVGSVATGANPYSVYVQGRYAYTANYSANTLQIFDVSNPASPTRVSSVATGTQPYSVYVQGRYAYVGYIGGTPDALQIIDVSNPASPVSVGSVATGANPESVYVQGRYAYLVNSASANLQVFDLGGSYIQQLETGGLETGTLATRSNAQIGNDLDIRGGLVVGRGIETTGPFSVYGGSGTGLIVNYNGNVGIGITLPQDKLTITGGTLSLDNQGDLRLYDADNSNYTGFQGSSNALASVTYTLPDTYGSSTQALSTSGTGPLYWVSTGGGITAVGSMTTGPVFAGVAASGQWLGLGASAGRIQFRDLATDAVNLLDANIGIGTSTPAAKLHIVATGAGTNVTLRVRDNANRDTFACLDNGNVGLGTTAPITQLQVSGKVPERSTGFIATGSSPYSVYVQGRYAYTVDTGTDRLRIFDVSNPASPVIRGSVATGADPASVYVQGRYAYVSYYSGTPDALQIFDVSNPASPSSISSIATGANPYSVYVQGKYAYVVAGTGNRLHIFDVSNPASPSSVSSVATGSGPYSVYVQGRYAYVVNNSGSSLQIFDVSNPASPSSVSSVATGTTPDSVYVQGRYAYVVDNTLRIFDVSNPASPSRVGSVATGAWAISVYVQGRYAYVIDYDSDTLRIFDVSNPASPSSIGSVATGLGPNFLYVQGRYAYVVYVLQATDGLQIFDLGGSYIQQLETGGLETGTLATRSNAQVGNDLDVCGGLVVGRGIETTGPFSVYGGGTDSNFIVNYDGNVGIGTSNPSAKLYIEGNLKAKMQTSMTGSLAKWEGGTAGTVYELGYDVAETFATTEPVSIGDLLVSDKDGKLKKSSQPYAEEIIGVVSAAPAVLFEGSELQIAPQPFEFQTGSKPPVALSGRVKVKVTPENGAIRTGDYLTSSSKPGYAMKATQSGRVIGLALEDTTQETQITVFINPHWYGADLTRQRLAKLRAENAALKAKAQEFASRLQALESK